MIDFVKEVILTNLYWFSLPLIGYAFLRIFKETKSFPKPLRNVADIVLRQHPFCIFVAGFATTTVIFAIISIFFYLFRIPVLPLVIIYLIFLVVAIVYLLRHRRKSKFDIIDIFGLRNKPNIVRLLFVFLIVTLIINYTIYACVGSSLAGNGDTIYHLSRMLDILEGGFNVQSSFIHKFMDLGYHFNVIYALYVIPAKLFGYIPLIIWKNSLGFYNLMSLSASFVFALFVFKNWVGSKKLTFPLAIISMFPVMAYYSYFAFIANYPDRIVKIWIILFLICLYQKINKMNFKAILLMLLSIALVITMTQPLYAVACACFVFLLALTRLVIQRKEFIKDKLSLAAYSLTVVILMIGPLITKSMPVRVSPSWVENSQNVPHYDFFGMAILKPILNYGDDIMAWIIATLGIVAIIYLIFMLRKRKYELSFVISLMFFYTFFAFTPICGFLNKFMPLWAIARFEDIINILCQFYLTIATFCLFNILYKLIRKRNPQFAANKDFKTVYFALFFVVIVAPCFYFVNNYYKFVLNYNNGINFNGYINFVEDYKSIFKDNRLVITNDGYELSSLFRIDILSVPYGHSVIASDGVNRSKCMSYITKSYNLADLEAVGADFVVVTDEKQAKEVLGKKPYLKLIGSKKEYFNFRYGEVYVYEVIDSYDTEDSDVYEPCLEYQRNEEN